MLIGCVAEEHPLLAQQRDDVGVRIENIFAGEIRQAGFIRITAVIVHG